MGLGGWAAKVFIGVCIFWSMCCEISALVVIRENITVTYKRHLLAVDSLAAIGFGKKMGEFEHDIVVHSGINVASEVENVDTDAANVQFKVRNVETDVGDNDKEDDVYGFNSEDDDWRGEDYQSGNEGGRSSSDSDDVEYMKGDNKRKRKSKVYDTSEYETKFHVENGGNSDWDFCCNEGPTTSQTAGSQSNSTTSQATSQVNTVENSTSIEGGVRGCGGGAQSARV
ncbi:unnamed protein product [Ilex paraguariensis]|uniref:Uncharacterized protein n=1 Tax=Ilex paraguariensis TaxID=185542 RepID=A0ABC8UZE4_9AQUA